MKKNEQKVPVAATPLELRHLGRDVKTALELGIVAMAPTEVVENLALAAGFLSALEELPLVEKPSAIS